MSSRARLIAAETKDISSLLEILIGNDPLIASAAFNELTSSVTPTISQLITSVHQRIDSVFLSPIARVNIAKLFSFFGEDGVELLIRCIQSGNWKTKLFAATCLRFTKPSIKAPVESAMLGLLGNSDRDTVRAAIVSLGHIGSTRAIGRITETATRDHEQTFTLDALNSLLRLTASDDSYYFDTSIFSSFNMLFQEVNNKSQALSHIHFVLPEIRGQIRDEIIDLIVRMWIQNDDMHLRLLGADALGTLRVTRVRTHLSERIQQLSNEFVSDRSVAHMALAWGCIGATDDTSLDTLRKMYLSGDRNLKHCASIVLSYTFPALMSAPPAKEWERFLTKFVEDTVGQYDSEQMAYILWGVGQRRKMNAEGRAKLSSPNILVRAGTALAIAFNGGRSAPAVLREYTAGTHALSFERLVALTAMTRFDANAADGLHETLCKISPDDLWRLRHGVAAPWPVIFNPYPWMREIIYALNRRPVAGRACADAWAEALLLNATSCIAERDATEPPKVFISYSRDDREQERWVVDLAARLNRDAIDTILDHDVPLGGPLVHFMERAVDENDFVLCICTPRYKARFDGRLGGVGFEADLMGPLFHRNKRKFIPVLREGDWEGATPGYLRGTRGVDLRRGAQFSKRAYEELRSHIFRREK
jgi:hypothetical protein